MVGSNDNSQHCYRLMLQNISHEVRIRNICLDQLKFAIFDFVPNRRNLEKANTAFELFLELDNVGHIAPDDVNLLIALFKLLWLNRINDLFFSAKFQIANIQPSDKFSSFRISIVNLSNKLQNSKIVEIAGLYGVPEAECLNSWKLLQYLQDEGKLHEGSLIDLVTDARINRDVLQWHPANSPSVKTASTTLHLKFSGDESSATCSNTRPEDDPQNGVHHLAHIDRPSVQLSLTLYEIAAFFSLLGFFCEQIENSSIVFHIFSYNPKAMRNLWKMYLDGQLLKELTKILVIEEYKLQFLDNSTITIDETKFHSAVSKLEIEDLTGGHLSTLIDTGTSSQPRPEYISGNTKRKFRTFLENLSDQYRGNRYLWLRFLLYDHLSMSVLSRSVSGMTLFNELHSRGYISPTDISILSDVVDVIGLVTARKCVDAYKQEIECKEGKGLTPFRKNLFKGLQNVTNSDVHLLIAFYNLSHLHIDNIWDLVFCLERRVLLNTPSKLATFAENLSRPARDIIIDALKDMNLQPTEATTAGQIERQEKQKQQVTKATKKENKEAEIPTKSKVVAASASRKAATGAKEKIFAGETADEDVESIALRVKRRKIGKKSVGNKKQITKAKKNEANKEIVAKSRVLKS